MDTYKSSQNYNLKDIYLHTLSANNETYIPNINSSNNHSNVELYSPPRNDEKINLEDSVNRRKTLISAATIANISKLEWSSHKIDEIDYLDDGELVEVGTQIEEALLDCYRVSPPSNPNLETYCLQINDQNNEIEGNLQKSAGIISHKGTQIDVGLLDLYSFSPHLIQKHTNNFQQSKEEKQIDDDIQGLTGLALLAGSTNISPKSSPKISPRNNLKLDTLGLVEGKHLINQLELIGPKSKLNLNLNETLIYQSKPGVLTSRPRSSVENSLINQAKWVVLTSNNNDNITNIVDRKTNDLQIGLEPRSGFSTNPIFNLQSTNNVPALDNIVNNSYQKYHISKPLEGTTWKATQNSTTSLVSSKIESKKELKLKHKAFENLLCRNEHDSSTSTLLKTPCKCSMPNFDYKRECFIRNSEGMQEKINEKAIEGASKNEGDCKEWFRERLWFFLFENLRRAIDELYFLCDLQGASKKMNEAILFLEEACQDFKELKLSIGVDKTNTSSSEMKSNGENKKLEVEMKGFQKKLDALKAQKIKDGFYNNVEENFENLSERKIIELETTENNPMPKVNGENYDIQKQVKQLVNLVIENETQNSISKGNKNESKHITILKNEFNEKIHESTLVIDNLEKNHDFETCKETLNIDEYVTNNEIKTNNKQLQNEVNEKNSESLIDIEKIESTKEPTLEHIDTLDTTNLTFEVDRVEGREKRNIQSSPWQVFERPIHRGFQFENRITDCKIGMIVNEVESPIATESKAHSKTLVSNGRNNFESLKKRNEEMEFLITTQNRAASVIGYRVDEERKKMVGFIENEPQKCKSNKKILLSNFTGRLMRPTESSNIRTSSNLKIKEKEKSNNKERNGTWTSTTKCHSDNVKQNTSWLNALATPRRGPSRFQGFEISQIPNPMNLIRKESFILQNLSQKVQIREKYQEIQKNKIVDTPKICHDNHIAKLQNQNQEKTNFKLNDKKTNKSKIEYVQKQTTKSNVCEYDIRHVEDRLVEQLKQGLKRRIVCLDDIKDRISLISKRELEDKFNKISNHSNFGKTDSLENQKALHKNNEYFDNVDILPLQSKGITLFQKQAMQKKIRNIRLKLANKRFEFTEPPLGIEGIGIGSATATGLAKGKIGKWMDELRQVQFSKNVTTTTSIVLEIAKCLEGKQSELHVARQLGLVDYVATTIPSRQDPTTTLGLLQIQKKLLYLPANRSYFIIRNLLPPLVPMLLSSLEIFNSFGNFYEESNLISSNQEKHEVNDDQTKRTKEVNVLQEILEGLLNCTISIIEHPCIDKNQLSMQDDLVDLLVACGLIHQLQNLFSIFYWQQGNQTPIPNSIIFSLKLLEVLTGANRKSLIATHEEPINIFVHKPCLKQNQCNINKEESTKESTLTSKPIDINHNREMMNKSKDDVHKFCGRIPRVVISQKSSSLSESTTFLIAAISETRLVGLLTLLIGMILPIDTSPQNVAMNVLPSNFNEVAIIMLQVLNNVARLDLSLVQNKLALPDVCLEFYQLMSFLLTYCTTNWKNSIDEIAALLLETMMFLGYATLLHPKNQALLRWGKSPTILQKMCNLPFVFFSDSKLTPILIGTLLAICYGSEINRDVVQQQLSMEILLTFLKSSKAGLFQSLNSTHISKNQEEIKNKQEKTTQINVKNTKNDSEEAFDIQRSIQRLSLPKTLFSPSKSMMEKEKLGMFAPSPSSLDGTQQQQDHMFCCSTIKTLAMRPPHAFSSKLSKSLDFNNGISSLVNGVLIDDVSIKNVKSPRLSNKNIEVNDKSKTTVVDPLPIAFELQNRFPKGLWTHAEDFFSSSSWMVQLVKCL